MKDRAFSIQRYILQLADHAGVEVRFLKVRRHSDLAIVTLYGDRGRVLALPAVFEDIFKTEDLELMHANSKGRRYSLSLAITMKLEDQATRSTERRQKLAKKEQPLLSEKPFLAPSLSDTSRRQVKLPKRASDFMNPKTL